MTKPLLSGGKMFNVGDRVVAQNRITERGLIRQGKRHVHAEPGDLGRVVHAEEERRTVTWERSGTSSTCDVSELGTDAPVVPYLEAVERMVD